MCDEKQQRQQSENMKRFIFLPAISEAELRRPKRPAETGRLPGSCENRISFFTLPVLNAVSKEDK